MNKSVFILIALFAGAVFAQDNPPDSSKRPHIDFDARTLKAFDRSGRYVTHSKASDGADRIRFNESFQNVTVARLGADGKIETLCTASEEEARRFLSYEKPFALESISIDEAGME